MRRTHSSLLKELDVDPQVRAEQMGHTVDVNENVYTTTSINRRKEAVNALERAVEAKWTLLDSVADGVRCKLLILLERETGIEPATSSLGK